MSYEDADRMPFAISEDGLAYLGSTAMRSQEVPTVLCVSVDCVASNHFGYGAKAKKVGYGDKANDLDQDVTHPRRASAPAVRAMFPAS